ncbi:MAG: metallopeptidase TldD-related protein, partial [Bryobacteraceae bacterium]
MSPPKLWVLLCLPVFAADPPLVGVLAGELERNFRVLKEKADPPPYFLSYSVTETESAVLSATLGSLTANGQAADRALDVSVRVGSPQLDNYHRMRGDRVQFTSGVPVSLDDHPDAVRRRLWLETDRVYRAASERLIKIRTSSQVKVAEEDSSADFSGEEPSVYNEPPADLDFPRDSWAERVRKLSAAFGKHPAILTSSVSVRAMRETKHLVTSEGTRLRHGRKFFRVTVTASGRAEDGMNLATAESFEAAEARGLPADKVILAAIEKVAQELDGLLKAPVVDPFVGPAILSGRASGVFFHEIFGHRIEGHRQKDETEGQTFTKSVNAPVLPEFLSVVFDPTRTRSGDADLNGRYRFDDEGVAARPVTVVDKGVLKT